VQTPIEGTIGEEVGLVQSKVCFFVALVQQQTVVVIVQRLGNMVVDDGVVGGSGDDVDCDGETLDLIVHCCCHCCSLTTVGVSPSEIFPTRCTETFCEDGKLHS